VLTVVSLITFLRIEDDRNGNFADLGVLIALTTVVIVNSSDLMLLLISVRIYMQISIYAMQYILKTISSQVIPPQE
jgi:hypothetical protein